MKSKNTDKTIGLNVNYEEKFRDIRHRAKDEEINLRKNKRDKQEHEPRFKIEELVVITNTGYKSQDKVYQLVEVLDIVERYKDNFEYFAIVRKTTEKNSFHSIGRLTMFSEQPFHLKFYPANINPEDIKWIEKEN